MRYLLVFAMFFAFVSTASAASFIEAQMNIKTLGDGTKAFKITWDEKHKTALIAIKLEWTNYDPALHKAGFDLKSGKLPYLVFPELYSGCKLASVDGKIGDEELEDNLLYMVLTGEKCPRHFEDFKIPGMRLSLYEVLHIHDDQRVNAFHIWLQNAPTTIDLD